MDKLDALRTVAEAAEAYYDNPVGTREAYERAICRAAAEITGLRPELAYAGSLAADQEWETRDASGPLRRFAELAREET
jgi:hypothetical protein